MSLVKNANGLGVKDRYGAPKLGEDSAGKYGNENGLEQVSVEFRGSTYGIVETKLPAGVKVLDVLVDVDEAFVLGGTSPTINVGTKGSAATDGVSLSEAQAEAVGVYSLTANGTWASPLTAATDVAVELGGTSPTITDAGHAKVTISYIRV